MANNSVTPSSKQRFREEFLNLDPVELLSQIRALQQALATLAETETAKTTGATDVTSFLASLPTLWKNGEVRSTHRIKVREARWWRTRHDPFKATWPLIRQWLEAEPHATGKELLRRIQAELPEQQMTMAQLRTNITTANQGMAERQSNPRRRLSHGLSFDGCRGTRRMKRKLECVRRLQ